MYVQNTNIAFGPGSEADFIGNTASSGGGIYTVGGSIRFSGKSLFMNNMATNGGAVYAESNAKLTCDENCTFVRNVATNRGAAVWITYGTVNLNGQTAFVANNARIEGAGIDGTNSYITCNGTSTFISNIAGFGAALDLKSCTVVIQGNTNFQEAYCN